MQQSVNAQDGRPTSNTEQEPVFDHGVLHVEIYEARGIKGDELHGIGKADPYLVLKHGNSNRRVSLESQTHDDGGSNPVFNTKFCFPLRNGGTKEHNILEIEIWNENKHTRLFRRENCLGHLRIGRLAGFIQKHDRCITEPLWYPIFYKRRRRSKDQTEGQQKGEILMKFYFQNVDDKVFAEGHHTELQASRISSESGFQSSTYQKAEYTRMQGGVMSGILGGVGPALGIDQTVLLIL